jgi:YegS/Rv2252/BmrU family lipid kinase
VSADRATLLVNPTAGAGRTRRHLPAVRAELDRLGVDVDVRESQSAEHAAAIAGEAAASKGTVIAFGGDGLLRLAARELAGTTATMGVLPGGRGNDFARSLGISLDPVEACRVVAAGAVRAVDLGDVDGEVFLGVASCGLDSDVNKRANEARLVRGRAVYIASLFGALARWRPVSFGLDIDGQRVDYRGYNVAVGNSGRYGGGVRIAPDAVLDDGLLDVIITRDTPRWRFVANIPKGLSGTHVDGHWVESRQTRAVRVEADRPLVIYADGDPIGETPATVSVRAGALRVLAPTP